MRIAIDAHTLSGPPQGVRTYVENIVQEIAARSQEVELILLVNRPQARPEGWPDNIRFVEWGGGRAYRLTAGARVQMRRLGCSVFHCSYFLPVVPMPNPLVTIHDLLPETHPQFFSRKFALAARYWFRYSARHARHLFAPSEYARQSLIEYYGVSAERVSVTPCAVNFRRFNDGYMLEPSTVQPTLRSQDYYLIVGRFDPRKDHATAVAAYASVLSRRKDLPRLVIAGSSGPSEQAIRSQIAAHKLEERILILKNVPDSHLPTLYAHAIATISTSRGEGFGLPMVEAMAAGSPVICADNTAQTEVVKGYGLMFQTASAEGLAAAIEQILDDCALRAKLRERGLARARDYTWRKGAQVFLDQARLLAATTS